MRIWKLILLAATIAFGGGKDVRYVFSLLDSNFVIKERIETFIHGAGDPDSSLILSAANSVSHWNAARLNSKPVDDVWLAYEPPADPGTIIFVSNTVPAYPLLTLKIDAMCGGCVHDYSVFGSVSVPDDSGTDGSKLRISELANDFKLGRALSEEERRKIAEKINDFTLSSAEVDSLRVNVLKLKSDYPTENGFRYVAYFSYVSAPSAISHADPKATGTISIPGWRYDALGRSPRRNIPAWGWRTF
ncbi:MAG: hypothetical protein JWO30_1653 [Fibrobacteres bacterium]|nr:hypothetical protein [Fibrobacterota bacterium]